MTPEHEGESAATKWVLVPVKAFTAAKMRLETVLDSAHRADLARQMAAHVLDAAAPLPTCVACDDRDVATFAEAHGARVAWTPGLGLNGAVMAGIAELRQLGATYVTVVHADLPTATRIGELADFDGVTLAPDRRGAGTNLLRIPTAVDFAMQFGRDSLRRHLDECARTSQAVWVLEREDLAFDVDEPEDLRRLAERNEGTP